MSTLQSAHQYRQDSWSFNFREESEGVTSQRQKGRKAETRRDTIYNGKCRRCLKEFECNSKDQPYCSHKCFTEYRKESKYKELQCISCLSSLGFGVKAITKRFYKVAPETVRSIIIAKGFNRSNSQQANRRLVDSTIKLSESEKNKQHTIRRINLSLKKINKLKKHINLIIRAQSNYGAGFDWRNLSNAAIRYWANIEQSRINGRRLAKKKIIIKGSHNHIKKICLRMIWRAIKSGYVKKEKTMDYFGCSSNDLKVYLQSKFKSGMNWNNYGSVWEVDHIVPCDSFDLKDHYQVRLCNHYTNLQPMLKSLNRRKSNKFIGSPVQLQIL